MKNVLIPVIHTKKEKEVLINVDMCVNNGINNIMLISHGYYNFKKLINLYNKIKTKYQDLKIGINFLDLDNNNVFQTLNDLNFFPDFIWIDNCFENLNYTIKHSQNLFNNFYKYKINGFDGLFFCGFAFKYQEQPKDLKEATKKILPFFNDKNLILTTSGNKTGVPPTIEKIIDIFNIVDDQNIKLCIASGINNENIKYFTERVKYFLVSTSINDDENILIIKEKLNNLQKYF